MAPVADLLATLQGNQFFSAGFGLMGVGMGVAAARKCMQYGMIFARRRFFVSLEIPSKDKSYQWVLEWLSVKGSKYNQHISAETTYFQHESGDVTARVNFIPSVGTHYISYKNRIVKVERTREKNVVDAMSGGLWESITLTTIGRSRSLFQGLIEEAMMASLEREEGKTVIYTSIGSEWKRFGHPRRKRPLHSVILDSGLSSFMLDDIKQFLLKANWYSDRGIPYRRGFLLYGPPGCGKSSFITALAGELGLNICILNLSAKSISDLTLNQLLNNAPQRSIILLEDIDVAVNMPQRPDTVDANGIPHSAYYTSHLTFSGLLNALDGVAASEGRIMFMTTNHIERLQPALIRPGRVDVQIKVDTASTYQIETLFKKFFPGEDELCAQFLQKVPNKSVSMAQLQGHFVAHSGSAKEALDTIDFSKKGAP